MTLFAAEPDVSAIGSFVQVFCYLAVGLAGVIGAIAGLVSLMRRPEKATGENYVTRTELQQELTRLETEIKELHVYTRDRTHKLGGGMHVINLRIVYMMGLLSQLCGKQGIAVPPEPNIAPTDET